MRISWCVPLFPSQPCILDRPPPRLLSRTGPGAGDWTRGAADPPAAFGLLLLVRKKRLCLLEVCVCVCVCVCV